MKCKQLSHLGSILVFAVAATAACGQETGEAFDSQQGGDADTDTDTDSDSAADSDADSDTDLALDAGPATGPGASFVGNWGQLIGAAVKQTGIPIVGAQIVDSRNWYLVTIETDDAGNITAHEKLCSIKMRLETWLNKSIVPQNFVDHMEILERHVSVESDKPGTPWISDTVYEVRGAKLENIATDPLPPNNSAKANQAIPCAEAELGSRCDEDEDGHPGVTNILSGALNCQIYATQRWWAKFEGEVIDENNIAGPITDSYSEQNVLAASQPLCTTSTPGSASVIDDCPEHFYFKMVRLNPDSTCDDVMELTSCDENEQACIGDESLPLNPRQDAPGDCK